jgi:hypothetical protein
VRTGSRTEQVSDAVEPNHPLGRVTGHRDSGLRRVDGCPGVMHAANRAAAVMGAMLAGWIGLARLSRRQSRIGVTNDGRLQRIGGDDAGGPACADRCKNLHRHGSQDDREKFPQPPPHQRIYLLQHCQLIMHRAGCRDRGSRDRCQTRSWTSKVNASLGMPGDNQIPMVLLAARGIFKAQSRHCYLARNPSSALSRNPGWRNSDHFVGCSNFEQSLLKMMTRRKRWSNS